VISDEQLLVDMRLELEHRPDIIVERVLVQLGTHMTMDQVVGVFDSRLVSETIQKPKMGKNPHKTFTTALTKLIRRHPKDERVAMIALLVLHPDASRRLCSRPYFSDQDVCNTGHWNPSPTLVCGGGAKKRKFQDAVVDSDQTYHPDHDKDDGTSTSSLSRDGAVDKRPKVIVSLIVPDSIGGSNSSSSSSSLSSSPAPGETWSQRYDREQAETKAIDANDSYRQWMTYLRPSQGLRRTPTSASIPAPRRVVMIELKWGKLYAEELEKADRIVVAADQVLKHSSHYTSSYTTIFPYNGIHKFSAEVIGMDVEKRRCHVQISNPTVPLDQPYVTAFDWNPELRGWTTQALAEQSETRSHGEGEMALRLPLQRLVGGRFCGGHIAWPTGLSVVSPLVRGQHVRISASYGRDLTLDALVSRAGTETCELIGHDGRTYGLTTANLDYEYSLFGLSGPPKLTTAPPLLAFSALDTEFLRHRYAEWASKKTHSRIGKSADRCKLIAPYDREDQVRQVVNAWSKIHCRNPDNKAIFDPMLNNLLASFIVA